MKLDLEQTRKLMRETLTAHVREVGLEPELPKLPVMRDGRKEFVSATQLLEDEVGILSEVFWEVGQEHLSRSNAQVDDVRLKLAFMTPFFATEQSTVTEATTAIKELVARKSAEGKPSEEAALEIIHEHYQGMDEEHWPYLQKIRLHYVTLLESEKEKQNART